VDIDHAERMRQALVNENADLAAQNPRYAMRITGDNDEGKRQLDNFIAEETPEEITRSNHPVIVTTSKLMTTGVDCKLCKLIVLDNNINSMTEFKQIIGRGTRLKPEYGKEFFTIMDFRNACRLFADPEFDGDPIVIIDEGDLPEDEANPPQPYPVPDEDGGNDTEIHESRIKYRVNDVEVTILNERVQYYDKDGKLITESVTDYSKKNILGKYATLDDFLSEWNTSERKQAIIDELKERGVLLDALRDAAGNRDIDDFDLICHIAFDKKPLTKAERAANVRKQDYLNRYEGVAREVLSALLDKYTSNGIADLEQVDILRIDPFRTIADLKKIFIAFGGKKEYLYAVKQLQNQIYAAA
jgi:type I restriction enzyme R subunit